MRTPPLLADFIHHRVCKPICEKLLTLPSTLMVCSMRRFPRSLLPRQRRREKQQTDTTIRAVFTRVQSLRHGFLYVDCRSCNHILCLCNYETYQRSNIRCTSCSYSSLFFRTYVPGMPRTSLYLFTVLRETSTPSVLRMVHMALSDSGCNLSSLEIISFIRSRTGVVVLEVLDSSGVA